MKFLKISLFYKYPSLLYSSNIGQLFSSIFLEEMYLYAMQLITLTIFWFEIVLRWKF